MEAGGNNITFEETVSETDAKNMDAIDVLLQRSRSERMDELRQIQHDNRPVTGQAHRDQINHFLSKNQEMREVVDAAHASGKENVPLNTANVEEHRPEAVIVEIQGLTSQHRVSSVLQTAAFRHHLENIVRGSMRSVASSHNTTASHLATPPRPLTPVVQELSREPTPLSLDTSSRRDSVSSHNTLSSDSSEETVDYSTRIRDPRGLLSAINNSVPAAPPVPEPEILEPRPITLELVNEIQREDIIQEVSELVHRRLVTSTLEGEFRNILEFHIRDRANATGGDMQRVQEFIQSIPQSQPHMRNDFSNLGIPGPAGADNWDNISVTSVSATAVPYTQTNLFASREIAALKAQMQEMRNMLKVSFDLQLDIQRSIRQEVAAGLAAAAGPSSQPEPTMNRKSRPVNDTHCLICLDNHSDSVLYQCGHMCVCFLCGQRLMERGANCPVCRAPIRDIIRCYRSNED